VDWSVLLTALVNLLVNMKDAQWTINIRLWPDSSKLHFLEQRQDLFFLLFLDSKILQFESFFSGWFFQGG
jgi:hypothetical protein